MALRRRRVRRRDALYNATGTIEDASYFGEQPLRFPLAELCEGEDDVEAYARRLGELLFTGRARVLLDRTMAASESMPVDLRLLVDRNAPVGYQAIRWRRCGIPDQGKG